MALTPARFRLLEAAIQQQGRVVRARTGNSWQYKAGDVRTPEATGAALVRDGWLAPVYEEGTKQIKPAVKTPTGYVVAYLYQITDEGRAKIESGLRRRNQQRASFAG